MLFALLCEDRPDAGTLRADTRAAHLDYLGSLGPALRFAGPFPNENDRPTGSLVVVEAADETQARAIADADPYAQAELFASVTIRRWRWAVNAPAASS